MKRCLQLGLMAVALAACRQAASGQDVPSGAPPGPSSWHDRQGGYRPPRMPVPPHMILERLSGMTPDEREHFLSRLPADRRERLEQRLREFESMPPEDRERLRRESDGFQQ